MAERGRFTHDRTATGEHLVVFLIGMHFTKPWRIDAWLPVFLAMPRMLAELAAQRDRGLLGYRTLIGWGGPTLVQYWRDVDALYDYAADRDAEHRPAWAAFNRRARKAAGAVGIWHETFPTSGSESVHVDMPPLGLAKAVGRVPVTARLNQARDRLEQTG